MAKLEKDPLSANQQIDFLLPDNLILLNGMEERRAMGRDWLDWKCPKGKSTMKPGAGDRFDRASEPAYRSKIVKTP